MLASDHEEASLALKSQDGSVVGSVDAVRLPVQQPCLSSAYDHRPELQPVTQLAAPMFHVGQRVRMHHSGQFPLQRVLGHLSGPN